MKRLLCLMLAMVLLCSPVSALDLSEYEQVLRDLKDSAFFTELFENEELKAKTQELLTEFRAAHEDIKAMSDEELRTYITETAAAYHIPPMNEEQIGFLVDVCRSLESAEQLGETLQEYEQRATQAADTAKSIFDTLGKLLDKLNEVLSALDGILAKFEKTE